MIEEWAEVPGFGGKYEVSSCGRIKSRAWGKERIMQGAPDREGYLIFHLRAPGIDVKAKIHRLVARAFVPPFEGILVRHLDDDPTNNQVSNLAWGTHAENSADRLRNGMAQTKKCKAGHLFTPENTSRRYGRRVCATCDAAVIRPIPAVERTHCKNGHEYTDANTVHQASGRVCKACRLDRQRAYIERKRHAA